MIKLLSVALLLCICVSLSGCSLHSLVGDGRGDWTLELFGGYAIVKVNSYCINLVRLLEDGAGSTYIIPNFFVQGFQTSEPYILLKGIRCEGEFATDIERNATDYSYYLFNTADGMLAGPYASFDELAHSCADHALLVQDTWLSPQSLVNGIEPKRGEHGNTYYYCKPETAVAASAA
ncbi:MAG: hypothetical protein E7444_02290 [Ruminococcaceae bacterium]|nr:hypothetical protein [Oscillospiraceae bacterium]